MPSNSDQFAPEEVIAQDRKSYLVGRFKVFLHQTNNHPDQRALDQSWVDSLVEQIGDPSVLNRALHPIGVILNDDCSLMELKQLLECNPNKSEVPELPKSITVLVFAGQHRLAMISQLGLDKPEQCWWHADVYMRALELQHPAEFLTMMHESNTPKIMKQAGDADLFRAVVKLKGLLDAKSITQEVFLRNRRALLSFDKNTSRCISNLTRNNELAQAIMRALSKAHIANVFSAGSWRRLTTGRLYMVSAGLIQEMVKQVDLLCEGMIEVPKDVLCLQPNQCRVRTLEGLQDRKKKASHAWDVLPGGTSAAIARATTRPPTFVTPLNPKTRDPWSLPEQIMLPSCLGASVVEDELKTMQKLMQHLLKMTCKPEHLERYTSTSSDTLEIDTDHPAGIIAHTLQAVHVGNPKVISYEGKIIQSAWSHRVELNEELKAHNIPDYQLATKEDYQRLVKDSEPWWNLVYLFKIRRFPYGLKLEISKEFNGQMETNDNMGNEVVPDDCAVPSTSSKKRSQGPGDIVSDVPTKRSRGSKSGKGSGSNIQKTLSRKPNAKNPDEDEDEEEDDEMSQEPDESQSAKPHNTENSGSGDEFLAGDDNPLSIRRGGDRRLQKVISDLTIASQEMSRAESRTLTELLQDILEARQNGTMQELLECLIVQAEEKNTINEKTM